MQRNVFGIIAAAVTVFGVLAASPASAQGRCSSRYTTRTRYVTYRDYDYGSGYGGYRRYADYGDPGYGGSCRRYRSYRTTRVYYPRRRRSCNSGYRTTRYYTTTYASAPSRYRCGCGERFASAYWLDYHRDHVHGW